MSWMDFRSAVKLNRVVILPVGSSSTQGREIIDYAVRQIVKIVKTEFP